MKEQILKLRAEGKTYNEIVRILGCSKGTVCYHCGEGQKEKSLNRQKIKRKKEVMLQKTNSFQCRNKKPCKIIKNSRKYPLKDKTEDFQRERERVKRNGKACLGKRAITFNWRDVIEKFGWNTTCYLTGDQIDLKDPKTYQFDHKTPVSRDGNNLIENLGICTRDANRAKYDKTVDEFIDLCKKVLEHNGYEVKNLN